MLKNRLRQLSELSLLQWWIILVALFTLPVIALSLKLSGFKQTKNRMSRLIPGGIDGISASEDDLARAQLISRAVGIAGNHGVYHANCLKQSLLTWWLLGRRGIMVDLKIGVDKDTEDFNAHAWVEYRGTVLVDATDIEDRFSAFGSR